MLFTPLPKPLWSSVCQRDSAVSLKSPLWRLDCASVEGGGEGEGGHPTPTSAAGAPPGRGGPHPVPLSLGCVATAVMAVQ